MGIEFQFCRIKSSRDVFHNNVHTVNITIHLKTIKIINSMCFLTQ